MSSVPGPDHKSEHPAGSPDPGEPVFLVVGRLRRPHGVAGDMVMEVLTDFPERLRKGGTVYLGDHRTAQRIRGRRAHDEGLLIAFEGYETPEGVAALRNQWVYVRADQIPELEEGEYYHHQIIGLRAVAEDGAPLGKVVEILETGANDVYVIRGNSGGEILVPAVDDFILDVNLRTGEMMVRLIEGMGPET